MKFFKYLILPLLISVAATEASNYKTLWEAKFSYYHPTDSKTRDLFGCGVLYNLEGTLCCPGKFSPWGSVGILPLSGHSLDLNTKTELLMFPIGVGVKYFQCFSFGKLYLGVGALCAHARTCNSSSEVIKKRTNWGFGGIAKSGIIYSITSCLDLDFFVDYSMISFDYSKKKNSGGRKGVADGLMTGLGIGVKY